MDAKAAIDRYLELLHLPNDLVDRVDPAPPPDGPGRVVFDGVDFGHRADDGSARPPILDGLDLEIRPGETLALVGVTGTGK